MSSLISTSFVVILAPVGFLTRLQTNQPTESCVYSSWTNFWTLFPSISSHHRSSFALSPMICPHPMDRMAC